MAKEVGAEIKHEIFSMLDVRNRAFPGSQPVSFDKSSMRALLDRDFYVCEKSDGVRCLMYLTQEEGVETAYMWDRRDDFYQVQNHHFPKPGPDPSQFWTHTLLDGELVNDLEADGSIVKRFLAFDCLVLDKKVLVQRSLDKRIAYMATNIYEPYKKLFKEYPDELQHQPFLFEMKSMQLGYAMEMLFRDVLPSLKHGNDGLIFTCRQTPYVFGTDDNIIKWKPPHENSIDFKLKLEIPRVYDEDDDEYILDYDVKPVLTLWIRAGSNNEIQQNDMFVTDDEWENLKARNEPLDERIVECYQDEQKRWRFMRFRDDKANANHISVFDSVMDSINDAISQQDLVAAAPAIKKHWKERQAAQPAQR